MKTHVWHLVVLGLILLGGGVTFFFVGGNSSAQLSVGIVTSLAYVAWGILHHSVEKDLHPKVVIEYVLIGLLAILVFSVVLR